MNNTQVLISLICHVEASNKRVNIGWDEVTQWQEGLLKRFVSIGILAKDVNTQSLVCTGCEHNCFMDIVLADDSKRAFIVCDKPDMQSQMGRIKVPLERLQQWQVSARQFALVIADLLGFDYSPVNQNNSASYKLGMLKGKNGRRWVILSVKPLALEVNGHTLLLSDLLYFNGAKLDIDQLQVDSIVDLTTPNTGKTYIPNTSKQESRKLATQLMYQNWNDEYRELQHNNPNRTDTWYSMQISKLAIAQGKSAGTIRKNMKK